MEKFKKKPTLDYIASLAGVSKTTVSRVLNESSLVKEDVFKRVESVIQETGYIKKIQVNQGPLSLSKLMVICDESALAPSSFYSLLLSQLKIKASKLAIQLEMSIFNQLTSSAQFSNKLKKAQALLVLGDPNQSITELAQLFNLPMVIINGVDTQMKTPCISPDYELSGFMAANYLMEMGHKKMKILTANVRHSAFQKTSGFLRAMRMANLPAEEKEVVINFTDHASDIVPVRGLTGKSLTNNPSGDLGALEILPYLVENDFFNDCSAVFCICDTVALSLIEAFSSAGIRVPEDISVIGFDNLSVGNISSPPLTTIGPNYKKMAQVALHAIMTEMRSPDKVPARSSTAVELIERESVDKVNA